MPPRKKTRIFLYLKVFVPVIAITLIAAVGYTAYAVNAITKSNRSLLSIKDFPKNFRITGEKWSASPGRKFRFPAPVELSMGGFLSVAPDCPESSSPMGWEIHGLT